MKKLLVSLLSATCFTAFAQYSQQHIGTTGSSFETVKFINNNLGFATGSNGDVYKTTNGGGDWTQITSPNGAILFGSSFLDASTWFVSGTGGTIYKTTDAGQTWTKATHLFTDCIYQIYAVNSTTIYAGGWGGRLLKSTDGGANFTVDRTDINTQNWIFGMQFTSATTGFAGGQDGTIYKTTDGAASWNIVNSGTSQTLRAMHFPTTSTGYAVGYSGTVVKTTDGGNNWSSASTGYSNDHYYGVFFTDAAHGYVVGSYFSGSGFGGTWTGVVLKTSDGGVNWTRYYTGGKQLNAVYEINGVTTIVGNDQRVLSNGNFATGIKETNSALALTTCPNPVNDKLFITFDAGKAETITAEVFDQLGSKVATLISSQTLSGQQQTSWETKNAAKGVYFLRFTSGNTITTRKFVVTE